MADARYSKSQVSITRRRHRFDEENKRLRELVADLPFNKIILLQEIWERQHREVKDKRHLQYKN